MSEGPPVFRGVFDTTLSIMKEAQKASFTSASSGITKQIEVIFRASFQEVDEFGTQYGAPHPAVWIKQDILDPMDGDRIVINDVEYLVREVKPASAQYTKLDLQDTREDW